MSEAAQRSGPLAGVKIIDMSSVVLGPFATLIFGDLGAEVIKIEAGQKGKAGDMMRYAGASPTGDLGPMRVRAFAAKCLAAGASSTSRSICL